MGYTEHASEEDKFGNLAYQISEPKAIQLALASQHKSLCARAHSHQIQQAVTLVCTGKLSNYAKEKIEPTPMIDAAMMVDGMDECKFVSKPSTCNNPARIPT